jgi:glutathione S-transferase
MTKLPWVEVDEARTLPGLRLVVSKGIPNPWSEGAKALFDVKKIPWTPVPQRVMGDNSALGEWTGQTSAPVAILDDEPPRTTWSAILHLAERLAPEPALIPADPEERTRMFGYLHELCGELGFGWCRRLQMAHAVLTNGSPLGPIGEYVGGRYGYGVHGQEYVERRLRDLLGLFAIQLRRQYDAGRPYFIGTRLSALDLYWSAFATLIQPLPADVCPMYEESRRFYTMTDPTWLALVDPLLLEHRDRIYREHLPMPLRLR